MYIRKIVSSSLYEKIKILTKLLYNTLMLSYLVLQRDDVKKSKLKKEINILKRQLLGIY